MHYLCKTLEEFILRLARLMLSGIVIPRSESKEIGLIQAHRRLRHRGPGGSRPCLSSSASDVYCIALKEAEKIGKPAKNHGELCPSLQQHDKDTWVTIWIFPMFGFQQLTVQANKTVCLGHAHYVSSRRLMQSSTKLPSPSNQTRRP